ncbi:MAG TPA: PaaI family thioesterase [Gammaproteobacteria bacterium]|nr:PaaI family thioesterase [Gammaproteobacteria bacterium]
MTVSQEAGGDRLAIARRFFDAIAHGRLLGMTPDEATRDSVLARLPYREELVGNPATGVIHGGVITTLVDETSGAAVLVTLGTPEAIATLDLRIDYLSPAEPHRDTFARSQCYRITRHIAFVRCTVYQSAPDSPIATSMSTFMRTGGRRLRRTARVGASS